MKVRPTLKHLAYRRREHLILFAVALVMAFAVGGVTMVLASSDAAVEQSVRLDQGGWTYATQAGTRHASRALSAMPGVVAVRDSAGEVQHGPYRSPAAIRVVSSGVLEVGHVLQGQHAAEASQVTVSLAIADDLGLDVGDIVSLNIDRRIVRRHVSGITADPADVTNRSVVLVDPRLTLSRTTTWLSATDPYSIRGLQKMMNTRVIYYRTVESLIKQRMADRPDAIAKLRYVPYGLLFLFGILLLSALATFRKVATDDAGALVAAGMSPLHSWRTLLLAASASLGMGCTCGLLASALLLSSARRPISGLFGQFWLQAAFPVTLAPLVVASMAATLAAVAVGPSAWARISPNSEKAGRTASSAGLVIASGGLLCATVMLGLGWHAVQSDSRLWLARLAPLGAVCVCLTLIPLTARILATGLPQASRRVLASSQRVLGVAAGSAAAVAILAGWYSATTEHNARVSEAVSDSIQPAGSLLVADLNMDVAHNLTAEYERLGGKLTREFIVPDESANQVRVSSSGFIRCVRSQGPHLNDVSTGCLPRSAAPLNLVLLTDVGRHAQADGSLIAGKRIGILLLKVGTDRVLSTAIATATQNAQLGGNLPGLILPAEGQLARELELKATANRVVAFLDFSTLPSKSQSRIRSSLARLAPTAQVSDASGASEYDQQRAIAGMVGYAGAALALVVLLLGGASVLTRHRGIDRVLRDVGAPLPFRRRLSIRLAAVPVLVALTMLPLAYLAYWILAGTLQTTLGLAWVAPGIAGMLGSATLAVALVRVPGRPVED